MTLEDLDLLGIELGVQKSTKGRHKVLPKEAELVKMLKKKSSIADVSSSSIDLADTSSTRAKRSKGFKKSLKIQGVNWKKSK